MINKNKIAFSQGEILTILIRQDMIPNESSERISSVQNVIVASVTYNTKV